MHKKDYEQIATLLVNALLGQSGEVRNQVVESVLLDLGAYDNFDARNFLKVLGYQSRDTNRFSWWVHPSSPDKRIHVRKIKRTTNRKEGNPA